MTNWKRVTPILEINHLHQGTEKKWWKAILEYFPAAWWMCGGGYTFHFHLLFVFYILTKPKRGFITQNWEYAKNCDFEEMTEKGNLLTSCTAPGAWKWWKVSAVSALDFPSTRQSGSTFLSRRDSGPEGSGWSSHPPSLTGASVGKASISERSRTEESFCQPNQKRADLSLARAIPRITSPSGSLTQIIRSQQTSLSGLSRKRRKLKNGSYSQMCYSIAEQLYRGSERWQGGAARAEVRGYRLRSADPGRTHRQAGSRGGRLYRTRSKGVQQMPRKGQQLGSRMLASRLAPATRPCQRQVSCYVRCCYSEQSRQWTCASAPAPPLRLTLAMLLR